MKQLFTLLIFTSISFLSFAQTATVKGKVMGSMPFRIKAVPKPFPMFGTKESGRIAPAEIGLQQIIWGQRLPCKGK